MEDEAELKIKENSQIFREPDDEEKKIPSSHWEVKKSLKPFYSGGRVVLVPGSSDYLLTLCNSAVHALEIRGGRSKEMLHKVRNPDNSGK